MADTSSTDLLSAANEAQVRLWFAAAGLGFIFLVISIISAPGYEKMLVKILSGFAATLFLLAFTWPALRRRLEARQFSARFAASLSHLATSAGAWFFLVFIIGATLTALAVYNRETTPAPPVLVGLRYVESRIPSTIQTLPYGLQVVIQTDKPIQGAIGIKCDGPIGYGNFSFAKSEVTASAGGIPPENNSYFMINIQFPDFLPENPIIARLYSEHSIKALAVQTE
jgi:hypothetical protein